MKKISSEKKSEKKKIFRQWWFWGIVIIVIVGVIMANGGEKETVKKTENAAKETVEENNTSELSDEEMIEICKKQTPFLKDKHDTSLGDAFEQYFSDNGRWISFKKKVEGLGSMFDDDTMKRLDEADIIYTGSIAVKDLKVNSDLYTYCKENKLDMSEDYIVITIGFKEKDDSIVYPYIFFGDITEDNCLEANEAAAKSMMFTIVVLADGGVSFENSMSGE